MKNATISIAVVGLFTLLHTFLAVEATDPLLRVVRAADDTIPVSRRNVAEPELQASSPSKEKEKEVSKKAPKKASKASPEAANELEPAQFSTYLKKEPSIHRNQLSLNAIIALLGTIKSTLAVVAQNGIPDGPAQESLALAEKTVGDLATDLTNMDDSTSVCQISSKADDAWDEARDAGKDGREQDRDNLLAAIDRTSDAYRQKYDIASPGWAGKRQQRDAVTDAIFGLTEYLDETFESIRRSVKTGFFTSLRTAREEIFKVMLYLDDIGVHTAMIPVLASQLALLNTVEYNVCLL